MLRTFLDFRYANVRSRRVADVDGAGGATQSGVGGAGSAGQVISPAPLEMYWLQSYNCAPICPDGAPAPSDAGRCACAVAAHDKIAPAATRAALARTPNPLNAFSSSLDPESPRCEAIPKWRLNGNLSLHQRAKRVRHGSRRRRSSGARVLDREAADDPRRLSAEPQRAPSGLQPEHQPRPGGPLRRGVDPRRPAPA